MINTQYSNNYAYSVNFSRHSEKKSPEKFENGWVMVTALSASGIGRIVGMDVGKDLSLNWAKARAEKLVTEKEEQKVLMEKIIKKIKLPTTIFSATAGVIIGFLAVLLPVSLIKKAKQNA